MLRKRTNQVLGKLFQLVLLELLLLLFHAQSTDGAAQAQTTTTTTPKTTSTTKFVPHRFTSSNNITILHEVRDQSQPNEEAPIVLNTHEVLPLKPVKQQIYSSTIPLLEKTIIDELEKPLPVPVPEYELHPVTFDFNLGDLEDLEHETIKKGDLNVDEEHLLSNPDVAADDEGLTYSEHSPVIAEGVDISLVTTPRTLTSDATLAITQSALPTVVTVSPHIFKILKNKTLKKGRELLKQEELQKSYGNNFNSISRYLSAEHTTDGNATTAAFLRSANLFQIMTNLYDHFYWQASEIRSKVTTACALEMQAYLTALHENYAWAQKAYDSSGRYRGQLFFGNDKWLGQKIFCYELNHQLDPEERKHFEFAFFAAVVAIRVWMPQKVDFNLQVGECLPKTCTSQDVHAILTLDPHAHMLTSLSIGDNSTNSALVQIRRCRTVPGIFSYWSELRFQVSASFMLTLICLVIAATWYQAILNRRKYASPIPAISGKVDANMLSHNGVDVYNNGKSYELYQMNNMGVNNNMTELESADVNGNRMQAQHACSAGNVDSATRAADQNQAEMATDVDKSQVADYRVETSSSAGANCTYEAKQQLGLHEQFLLCFAFQTNAAAILNIDEVKETQTTCVHGLRVFSVLWTIMVHTYLQIFAIGENRFQRIIVERSIWYQFVGNATFSVDTFFFISGFLVTLLFLKQEKKSSDNTGKFLRRSIRSTMIIVLYRYIRLTPAYLFVIFFNDFASRQTFDASVFQPTLPEKTCQQYWWRNILYINNFYPLSEICMIWSWYMANDMQFYIMASLLLVFSTRYFKAVVLILGTFLLSSWSISGLISLHYRYTHKVSNPFESFDFLYEKPWQRVGTYIIGMVVGYIVYKVKTPPRISSRTNWLLWICSLGLLGLIIFGVWEGELSVLNTAFYVSVGHTAFGVSLIWILLSCVWGLAPTINSVLSYRGLWPLSRLTYCTYLIHPVIMLIVSYRMSGTVHLNNLFVITIFFGNAVVSFIAAFFISVLFEAPVIRLLKIIFRK